MRENLTETGRHWRCGNGEEGGSCEGSGGRHEFICVDQFQYAYLNRWSGKFPEIFVKQGEWLSLATGTQASLRSEWSSNRFSDRF